ncbi:hypothetical protein G8770_22720 [Aestuariicella hydrocarbonica]|uniref:SnoaL-like domain-containing protein n=1 Tax=Pseudomaricurvus hydrocarbonicus TaxID=1470433 RepID=A0A9E5MQ37_9GAMM|nr:hypothetical protein [Aestuariicella hydrocarbonica]NHO68376.1 hypothetical protein [Aestuariicella hydrocarbonica]
MKPANHFIRACILATLLLFTGKVLAVESTTILTSMFTWWNHAMKNPAGLTQNNFGTYFTDDAAIYINGHLQVKGTKNMVQHFRKIQKRMDSIHIELPFIEEFIAGDKVFTYHRSVKSVDGVTSSSLVMGYITKKNEKISKVSFLRVSANDD